MNPNRGESYGTLAAIYLKADDSSKAEEIAITGLEMHLVILSIIKF